MTGVEDVAVAQARAHDSYERVAAGDRFLRRILVLILIIDAIVPIAFGVYVGSKADDSNGRIQQIQATLTCQKKDFDAVLYDIGRAFQNDKNPADYIRAKPKC